MGLPGRFGPLEERPFRLLWIGQTTSAIGDAMIPVALAFAVLDLTGSASDLGLVLATFMVARVVFLLAGGVWADRLPRRLLMIVCDVVRALAQASLAALLLADSVEVWHFVAVSAIVGAAAAFFMPASMGLVPQTVSAPRLQQANALMNASRLANGIAGPALAGLLVATAGTGVVFALDAATYVISAVFLTAMPKPPMAARGERLTFVADLAHGWRVVASRTWIWSGLIVYALSNTAVATFFVLGPLIAKTELGGAGDWALIMTGGGVGGLVGTVAALRFFPAHPLRVSFPIMVTAAVLLVLLVPPAPALVLAAAAGSTVAAIALGNTLWETALQEHVPADALSRVSSYEWMASLVVAPVGYAFAGPAADRIGVNTTLLAAAGVVAVANVGVLAVPAVRNLRRGAPEREPAPAAPVLTTLRPDPAE
jgi:MFS family permease